MRKRQASLARRSLWVPAMPTIQLPDDLLDDRVLTLRQIAAAASLHPRTLRRLIAKGNGPTITRVSDRKRGVRVRHLREWLEHRVESPSPDAA
jgi:hypothetical protein